MSENKESENKEIFNKLKAPFKNISWRIGSKDKTKTKARFLAYIDARDLMDRLDEIVGAENWQNEFEKMDCTNSIIDWKKEKREDIQYPVNIVNKIDYEKYVIMQCKLSIFINGRWVSKTDGAGARATETEKSLQSDALKRAAVLWGIGRYLYDVKSLYVELGEGWKDFSTYKDLPEKSKDILQKCLKDAENGIYQDIIEDNIENNKKETKKTEPKPAINKYYQAILDDKCQILENGESIVFNLDGKVEEYQAVIKKDTYQGTDYEKYGYNIEPLNAWVNLSDWAIKDNLGLTIEKAKKSATKFLSK